MHIRGRKNSSSTEKYKEHDVSSLRGKPSSLFQDLLQRMITSAARRKSEIVPHIAGDARHAGQRQSIESSGARQTSESKDVQQPKYRPAPTFLQRSAISSMLPLVPHNGVILERQLPQMALSAEIPKSKDEQAEPPQEAASDDKILALQMRQHRPKAREMRTDCSVCMKSLPLQEFPVALVTSTCLLEFHRAADESFICKSCINDSIQAQLDTSTPDRVHCPLCSELMTYDDVKRWAEHDVFEMYDQMITLQAIQKDGSFIRCCRPECEGGQFHNGGAELPVAICQSCGTMTCYTHTGLPWHEGLTCEEFEDPETAIGLLRRHIKDLELAARVAGRLFPEGQSQSPHENTEVKAKVSIARELLAQRQTVLASESDERGAMAVARLTKPCPQCQSPIEKRGGCKHIKCRCGFEFCYGCLAPWKLAHLATPCSAVHDHEDVLRLARMPEPPNPGLATNLREPRELTAILEGPRLPVGGVDGMRIARPRMLVPETMNETNWLDVPMSNRPAVRPPVIGVEPPLARRPRLPLSPQRPYASNLYLRSRDPQAPLASLPPPQYFGQAEFNPQGLDMSSRLGAHRSPPPAHPAMGAFEEALLDIDSLRNDPTMKHNFRPSYQRPVYHNFHVGSGRPQTRTGGNALASNLTRHYAPESHATEPLPLNVSYSIEQRSTMPDQRLQRPLHAPVMPTLHVESNTGSESHAMASVPQRAFHFAEVRLALQHQEL